MLPFVIPDFRFVRLLREGVQSYPSDLQANAN